MTYHGSRVISDVRSLRNVVRILRHRYRTIFRKQNYSSDQRHVDTHTHTHTIEIIACQKHSYDGHLSRSVILGYKGGLCSVWRGFSPLSLRISILRQIELETLQLNTYVICHIIPVHPSELIQRCIAVTVLYRTAAVLELFECTRALLIAV